MDRVPPDCYVAAHRESERLGLRVIWTSMHGEESRELLSQNQAVLIDNDISRGLHSAVSDWVLDRDLLRHYAEFEGLFVELLSRFAVSPSVWSVSEMSTHYYELVNFAEFLLQHHEPEAIFSFSLPHDPASFALYLASKRLRVPFLFLDAPIIANSVQWISCSLEERMLLALYPEGERAESENQKVERYIEQLCDPATLSQPLGYLEIVRFGLIARLLASIGKAIRRLFMRARPHGEQVAIRSTRPKNLTRSTSRLFKRPGILFKVRRVPWNRQVAVPSRLFWMAWQLKRAAAVRRKMRRFEDFAAKGKRKSLYVLFALPAQPEASTLPTSLENRNPLLLLRSLVSVLPIDVTILLRLHPAQFVTSDVWSALVDWRDPSEILDAVERTEGRVAFVSLKEDVRALIDGSIGVVVLNGTMGIEALSRGKRVIHSSSIWYERCEGAHLATDAESIHVAFQKMKDDEPFLAPRAEFARASTLMVSDPGGILTGDDTEVLLNRFVSSFHLFQKAGEEKWKI